MFRKKKEKYNLYLDEVDYIDSEDELLDEELLDEELLEEDMALFGSDDLGDEEDIDLEDIDLLTDDLDLLPQEEKQSPASEDLIKHETDPALKGEDILSDKPDLPEEEKEEQGKGPEVRNKKKSEKKSLFGKKKKEKKDKPPKKKRERAFGKKKKDDVMLPGSGFDETGKRISKKAIAAIAAAVVLALGGAVFFIIHNMGGGDDSKVYVESVGELTGLGSANGMNNRYTGMVEAQDSWKISLQSDMSVAKCFVSEGDEVKKGDKLFSYNTEELKLNKEKKELEVETLTNEINQLTKDITGYQNDLKNASASEKIELQTQILTAQTTIKKNEFSIKSGKEDIKALEKNIKDATVKSKMDGLVKKINTKLGENAGGDGEQDSYSDSAEDSTYMTILALGDYRIKGKISETNIWALNEGDPVIVRSRLDDDVTWTGTISKIKTDTNADSDSGESSDMYYDMGDTNKESASNYNFYVTLEGSEGLMLGQHVLVELDNGQDEERSGMWLNSAYLHKDGDSYYVWAANSRDRLTLKKIKVGKYNEDLDDYEITEGLSITDYIAADSDNLHENMRITKVDTEDGGEEYLDDGADDDEIYDDLSGDGLKEDDLDGDFTEGGEEGLGEDILDESEGINLDTIPEGEED